MTQSDEDMEAMARAARFDEPVDDVRMRLANALPLLERVVALQDDVRRVSDRVEALEARVRVVEAGQSVSVQVGAVNVVKEGAADG